MKWSYTKDGWVSGERDGLPPRWLLRKVVEPVVGLYGSPSRLQTRRWATWSVWREGSRVYLDCPPLPPYPLGGPGPGNGFWWLTAAKRYVAGVIAMEETAARELQIERWRQEYARDNGGFLRPR